MHPVNLNYGYLESQILPVVRKGHLGNARDLSPDLKRKMYDEMSMDQLDELDKEAVSNKRIGTAAESITTSLISIMIDLVKYGKRNNNREDLKYMGIEEILLGNYQGFYPGYPEDLIKLSLDEVVKKIKSEK